MLLEESPRAPRAAIPEGDDSTSLLPSALSSRLSVLTPYMAVLGGEESKDSSPAKLM